MASRGYFEVKIDSGPSSGLRNELGQFLSATALRTELKDKNRRHAREMQAQIVDHQAGTIRRRNVSSKRLRAVTANPKNIVVDSFFYGVGVEDFLDHSMAKYWRTIEEGSEKVWADVPTGRASIIGMELKGIWGAGVGRVTFDRAYGTRPWYPHMSSRRSDMFVPASRTFNFRGKYTGSGGKGGAPNFKGTTVVKHEIEAHDDYANVFATYRPGQKALADINEILGKAIRAAWSVEGAF